MVATYIKKKKMHSIDFCDSGVYSREINNMFSDGHVSEHVETLNFWMHDSNTH